MSSCSLHVLTNDDDRTFTLSDYEGARARWCPGCGDHSVLAAVEKLLSAEQLKPGGFRDRSSRFPHYLKTYGFHRCTDARSRVKIAAPLAVFA
jgi:pyruvate/2-oxoacid:ferredoxin oxidoreductase beta subunit